MTIGDAVRTLQSEFPAVTHSSLRFLEREGLLSPSRTGGRQRLFSVTDLDRVRQIKRWQAAHISLEEIKTRLADSEPIERVGSRLAAELLRGDHGEATRIVLSEEERGIALSTIYGDLIQPALTEVGARWSAGILTVSQEHEITELMRDLIAETSLRRISQIFDGPIALAACVEGERHEIGLRMIGGLLRAHGWTVHYLGSDIAAPFLIEAVARRNPNVVLLSATIEERLPSLQTSVAAIRQSGHNPFVIAGGQIAIHHASAIRSWGAEPIIDQHPAAALNQILALTTSAKTTARLTGVSASS